MNEEIEMYNDLIMYTVFNIYPDYYVDQLLEKLEENNKIILKKGISKKIKKLQEKNDINELKLLSHLDNAIDVSMFSKSKDKLNVFIEQTSKHNFLKFIEEYEFRKSYKHCVIYKMKNFNKDIIRIQEKNGQINAMNVLQYDKTSTSFMIPTYIEEENKILLKFSLVRDAFVNETERKSIKYPVIIVIDLNNNLIEIRFDKIKSVFQTGKTFYDDLIGKAKVWAESYLRIELEPLELRGKVKDIIDEYNKDMDNVNVIPMKRDVWLRNGSKVVLDINSNTEFIVPIIGDLKFIIKNNEEELKKMPQLYSQLMELVDKVDEGDVPKIDLFWVNENISIGIIHNYKEKDYSLIQYYGEIEDSEKMDYVRGYFNKN